MKLMKKNTRNIVMGIACFAIFLNLSTFSLVLSNKTSIVGDLDGINSDLKTSIIIHENSSDFISGTLENLTISEEFNLMLNNTFPLQAEWFNMTTSNKPSARYGHGMAYDSERGKVVIFGGYNGSDPVNDTWVYDLETNNWAKMNPSNNPSVRYLTVMAYDSEYGKFVLFGGYDGSSSNETWVYDLATNNWTNPNPSNAPSARYGHAMAYDSENGKVVLFGGYAEGYSDETWEYDLGTNTWNNLTTSIRPGPRYYHAIAYDSERGKFVLFGGTNDVNKFSDTWAYDLETNNWTNQKPSNKPSARQGPAMTYDSERGKVVLFGGLNTSNSDETWTYDLGINNWTIQNPSIKPSARRYPLMAYDPERDKVVLFGGIEASHSNETWVLGFEKYQTGSFKSKIEDLSEIFRISGIVSWIYENHAMDANIAFQIGFSNTTNDGDFVYTNQHDSSFTFEGVGRYIRYRAYFQSDASLLFSPLLKSVEIQNIYILPSAPTLTILTSSPTISTTISLEWTISTGADNYTLYRHSSEINASTLGDATVVETILGNSTTDTVPTIGRWYYAVVGNAMLGSSSLSNSPYIDVENGGGGGPIPGFDLVIIVFISGASIVIAIKIQDRKKKRM
jgi:hypothetical protein